MEPYYVVLRLDPLSVHKHTLPYFVPVESIAEKRLPVSIQVSDDHEPSTLSCRAQSFLDELCDYLHGFVMRREQLHRFKEANPEMGRIECTAPLDYIEFTNTSLQRYFKVQLAYDDLKQILPQRAVVLLSDE